MKAAGYIRPIDKLGRLVIPADIRKALDLEDGVSMEFFTDGDSIILKKYRPACIFCKSNDGIFTFKGHMICKSCLEELQKNNAQSLS